MYLTSSRALLEVVKPPLAESGLKGAAHNGRSTVGEHLSRNAPVGTISSESAILSVPSTSDLLESDFLGDPEVLAVPLLLNGDDEDNGEGSSAARASASLAQTLQTGNLADLVSARPQPPERIPVELTSLVTAVGIGRWLFEALACGACALRPAPFVAS